MHALRLSLGVALVVALVACGRGAKIGGGKEGAAAALFAASGAAKTQGSLLDLAGQRLDVAQEITVKCQFGGEAKLKGFTLTQNTQGNPVTVQQQFTLEMKDCVSTQYDDPKTSAVEKENVVLNGSMTVSQSIAAGYTGNVTQKLKGKILFGGAFDDFVDADITQIVEWARLGQSSGSVTITLNGSIATSTQSYQYANESVTVTAGVLVASDK